MRVVDELPVHLLAASGTQSEILSKRGQIGYPFRYVWLGDDVENRASNDEMFETLIAVARDSAPTRILN
jgi:hypothetical protein